MVFRRIALSLLGLAAALPAVPASAQIFLNPPRFATGPVDGSEPGMMLPLPGATPAEQRAGLLWAMRSGLNVAALQCQFEPTLMTLNNYNAILTDHREELAGAFDTLSGYFKRVSKTAKEGQTALDQYGTRVYSGFSAVSAQRTFCLTASSIGNNAVWTPRGQLATVAANRMRELRGSLTYTREPLLANPWVPWGQVVLPNLDDRCWDRNGLWRKRCDARAAR